MVDISECEAFHFCIHCMKETIHLFSGSATKGTCMHCGHKLKPETKADLSKVISYNG